jgi:hypothetical protein
MRKKGLACAGAVALVLAAQASATPQLNVSATAAGTTIGFSQSPTDPAPAKVQIFADSALPTVDLSAAAGTKIGTVTARAAAGALGGAILPLTGSITARGAGDTYLSNGVQVPLANASNGCTGTTSHSAFWVMTLSAAGQTLEVPLFVDAVTLPFAKAVIQLCLPSPDVPPPAGAAFGAKVVLAYLTLNSVFGSPSGDYRWRALVTTYTAGTANVNAAGTVETQGLEHAPGGLSFSAKRAGKGKAAVAGKVTEAGQPVPNITVVVRGGKRPLLLKTNGAGVYKATLATRSATAKLQATATVPPRDLGDSACVATFAAQGIPCVDAQQGGFSVTSPAVRPR